MEGLGSPGRVGRERLVAVAALAVPCRMGRKQAGSTWVSMVPWQIPARPTAGLPARSWDHGTAQPVAPVPAGPGWEQGKEPLEPLVMELTMKRWGTPDQDIPKFVFTPGAGLGGRHRPHCPPYITPPELWGGFCRLLRGPLRRRLRCRAQVPV